MRVDVLLGGAPGDVMSMLAATCDHLGYQWRGAEDLTTARALVSDARADLVCLAHYFQDGTAFELCREMRKLPQWRDCPIVLVTERANNLLIEKAFSAGFSETFQLHQHEALASFLSRYGSYRAPMEGEVLVVEDSPSHQQLVSAMLEQVGLNVRCVDCAETALESISQHKFDLVITDVVLKGELTGLDLITRIRRMEGAAGEVPIVVMSSYRSSAQRLEPFRIGADDYVSKPLEGDELLVRARRLIQSRALLLQVRDQQTKLEAANHSMSQMLSRVSHECRNSVNIVLGVSRILQRRGELTEADATKVATIENAGRHQLSLLNDILDFTKLEAGAIEFEPSLCDPGQLLAEACGLFRCSCEEQGIGLHTRVTESIGDSAMLDERLVKQVLINLLSNAVKFTREGAIELAVDVREGALIFSVDDSGPGIAEEELVRLFDAFRQTSSGKASRQGTGLGLSLCKGFAEVMGGRLEVCSTVGKGSTFSLVLPLQKVA